MLKEKKYNTILACSLIVSLAFSVGCATVDHPRNTSKHFSELMRRYPPAGGAFLPRKITAESAAALPEKSELNEIYIFVHPAYSMFFRDLNKDLYTDEKFSLLKNQFDHEEQVIEAQITAGKIVVLVLPGNYLNDSFAPQGYVSYLNALTQGGASLYYVLSETSSSGSLAANDLVSLYQFLQTLNAKTVMIGGGYIGRCQREFYDQLTNYLDGSRAFIVPEISTISPEDVTDDEALKIVSRLRERDYSPIKAFIDKKTHGNANILSTP
jgi:hypothetical protein